MVSEQGSQSSFSVEADSTVVNGGLRLAPKVASVEGSAIIIVPERLTGDNYVEWAQSMSLALDGRDRIEFIQDDPPSTNDAARRRWKTEIALVTSWLLNAMVPTMRRSFMFIPSAKDIWNAVKEAYGKRPTASLVFDLRSRLWTVRQGNRPLSAYYLEKTTLWQELDQLKHRVWRDAEDAATHRRDLEEERLFEFLVGLNPVYEDIRGRLLGRIPLPSVPEAFALLRDEEA